MDDRFDAIVDDIVAKETERYLEELAGVKIQREVATLRNTLREKQIQLHNTYVPGSLLPAARSPHTGKLAGRTPSFESRMKTCP